MALKPLLIPDRVFGQPIPVAPDMNQVVDKVDELVAAVNAGLATSNAIVGGPKYVRYTSSQYYNVPAEALTLDRLDPATILPGNLAVVLNPAASPLTATEPSQQYVAAIVPAATAGAVQVPAYSGAPAGTTTAILWQAVTTADTFTKLLASELPAGKEKYAGLELRPLLIAIIGGLGSANTVVTTPAPTAQPAAPTAGLVDDTADTFSFLPNPAYPSFAQYKVNGLPGVSGAVVLDATNSYVQGGRIYIKVVGAVAKGGLAVYVAGSGSLPDGKVLTNADLFTGAAVTPALTAALAISVASLTLGSDVTFTVTPAGGTAPYSYQVVATNTATGTQIVLGSTASGSWTPTGTGSYELDATVTDSASPAKAAQAATRYQQVQAVQNRQPVADAGSNVTIQLPTSSLALMGAGSDPDAGDSITAYAWRQIVGPGTAGGLPATTQNVVVTGLAAGTYQFGLRTTDTHGAQSTEDFVLVTVLAAASPATKPALLVFDGNSITRGYGSDYPYPDQVQQRLGSAFYTVQNAAVSGIETQGSLSKVASSVDALFSASTYSHCFYTLLIGVNNILHKLNPDTFTQADIDQCKADIEALLRGRVAAGFKVVASTLLRVKTDKPAFIAALDEISQHIRDHYQAWGCVALLDFRVEARLQDPFDTTVLFDGLHPTAKGDGYLADLFLATLNPIFASLGLPVSGASSGGSGTTAPVAPTITYAGNARRLTITHALGTNDLVVSVNGGAYVVYNSLVASGKPYIEVPAGAYPAGYYHARIAAVGARPAGDIAASEEITLLQESPMLGTDFDGFVPNGAGNSFAATRAGGTFHSRLICRGGAGELEFTIRRGTFVCGLSRADVSVSPSYEDISIAEYSEPGAGIRFQGPDSFSPGGQGFQSCPLTAKVIVGFGKRPDGTGHVYCSIDGVAIPALDLDYQHTDEDHRFDIGYVSADAEVNNVIIRGAQLVPA